jgi:hypothetical protein
MQAATQIRVDHIDCGLQWFDLFLVGKTDIEGATQLVRDHLADCPTVGNISYFAAVSARALRKAPLAQGEVCRVQTI